MNGRIGTACLLCLLAMAAVAEGQVTDRKTLTLDGAKRVIAAAVAEARAKNAPGGVVAVVDDGGNLMALERLDGTFAAGARISIGKARTAVMFKKPTRVFEDVVNQGRTAMVAVEDFTPLQGGIPIVWDGQIVGGIGVSGAASAQQDEEIAMAGATAFKAVAASPEISKSPVIYFDRERVAAAFAKGDVLFQGSANYAVHASRRDRPGLAEVHTRDTDVIYVVDGTCTFVTGGIAVDPRTIAPDEIRGKEISGGQTRRLSKGDVIIVPAGVPHWFKEIPGPFIYYVVKAR